MNKLNLIESIEQSVKRGTRFVSFDYTSRESGERAIHTINLGVDYANALKRDKIILDERIKQLKKLDLTGKGLTHEEILRMEDRNQTQVKCCEELLQSINKTLSGSTNSTNAHVYRSLGRGLKIHIETGNLHVWGFKHNKKVLQAGTFKPDTRRPKTVIKDEERKRLNSTKYRQFILKPENLNQAKINGETLKLV